MCCAVLAHLATGISGGCWHGGCLVACQRGPLRGCQRAVLGVCVPTAMHACAALPATLPGGRASAAGSAGSWECSIKIKGTVCVRHGPRLWCALSVLFQCATLSDWRTLLLPRSVTHHQWGGGASSRFSLCQAHLSVLLLLVAAACRCRVVGRACAACCALQPPGRVHTLTASCLLTLSGAFPFPGMFLRQQLSRHSYCCQSTIPHWLPVCCLCGRVQQERESTESPQGLSVWGLLSTHVLCCVPACMMQGVCGERGTPRG
jgi:hypothetical protein